MSDIRTDGIYYGVGQRVRTLRTRAGITQDQLAEALNVTRSSIANLEAGRQRSPLHVFVGIAQALGISVGELVDEAMTARVEMPQLSETASRQLEAEDRAGFEFVRRALGEMGDSGVTKHG